LVDLDEIRWAGAYFSEHGSLLGGYKGLVYCVIGKKNPAPLMRFLNIVKVGRVIGPYESNRGMNYFRCTKADEVAALKEQLWVWLTSDKQSEWAALEQLTTTDAILGH